MIKALPALGSALLGAAVAYLVFVVHPLLAAVLLIPALIGVGAYLRARNAVWRDPIGSLRWFEASQVGLYTIAAADGAAVIWVAVSLAPPEASKAAVPTTNAHESPAASYLGEILKAASGALSAFIAAAFVKPSEEPDSWVAARVEAEFKRAFTNVFRAGSTGEQALLSPDFGMSSGWDAEGRRTRAEAIAAALKDRKQLRP